MNKCWLNPDYDHIPLAVKDAADKVLTQKYKVEKEIAYNKKCLDEIIDHAENAHPSYAKTYES